MKASFSEYYFLDAEELNRLWSKGLIVFDTNVLLSLYRRSEDIRNDILTTIERLKDRIWIPHQVGYEFHEHRLDEAFRPVSDLDCFMDIFSRYKNEINNRYGSNPYIDHTKVNSAFKSLFSRFNKIIDAGKLKCPDFLHEDYILEKITDLFNEKIGPEYSKEQLAELFKVGNERYAKNVPPGYKDSKKTESERNRFGDLIIWMQIIEKAKSEKMDIIFVTDDRKEDWWEIFKSNTLGPRHELIREFRNATDNQLIWFYTPDRFLSYAKDKAGITVKPKTIAEVKKSDVDWSIFSKESQLSLGESIGMDNVSCNGEIDISAISDLGNVISFDSKAGAGLFPSFLNKPEIKFFSSIDSSNPLDSDELNTTEQDK